MPLVAESFDDQRMRWRSMQPLLHLLCVECLWDDTPQVRDAHLSLGKELASLPKLVLERKEVFNLFVFRSGI